MSGTLLSTQTRGDLKEFLLLGTKAERLVRVIRTEPGSQYMPPTKLLSVEEPPDLLTSIQCCPASPLLFSLYLDELEALLEASEEIDCPRIAEIAEAEVLDLPT
ncbi:hypothetical protein WJX84_010424 [Apatococcus fuscideae]|uniref:Uncharacterized protein n=1 Tax=Apatococcus fuscideae TaxID=2026836 RepID=A0AAW1SN77_9CHLO